jgi:hypothetical protein
MPQFLCYGLGMSPFLRRLLLSVVPTMVLLALCGYGLSRAAGAYVANGRDTGQQLAETLQWRLPITLAAWGGGLVFLMELIRHLWVKPAAKPMAQQELKPLTPDQEAEQLLLQLLEQSESAQARAIIPLDQTPPPSGTPLPAPDFAETATTGR